MEKKEGSEISLKTSYASYRFNKLTLIARVRLISSAGKAPSVCKTAEGKGSSQAGGGQETRKAGNKIGAGPGKFSSHPSRFCFFLLFTHGLRASFCASPASAETVSKVFKYLGMKILPLPCKWSDLRVSGWLRRLGDLITDHWEG